LDNLAPNPAVLHGNQQAGLLDIQAIAIRLCTAKTLVLLKAAGPSLYCKEISDDGLSSGSYDLSEVHGTSNVYDFNSYGFANDD
jgi:hypothetical protein